MRTLACTIACATVWLVVLCGPTPGVRAQDQGGPGDAQEPRPTHESPGTSSGTAISDETPIPPDYVIGVDDVLSILFWREKDLSTEVTVRPDGKISLPLLNEIRTAGLTPQQLRERLIQTAVRFVEDPNPTVVVKQINSRKVFITGQIEKPGPYPLNGRTTILQLIATAGGLREFADGKNIAVIRTEGERQITLRFNYQDVVRRQDFSQNIDLKPGDTVVVP